MSDETAVCADCGRPKGVLEEIDTPGVEACWVSTSWDEGASDLVACQRLTITRLSSDLAKWRQSYQLELAANDRLETELARVTAERDGLGERVRRFRYSLEVFNGNRRGAKQYMHDMLARDDALSVAGGTEKT